MRWLPLAIILLAILLTYLSGLYDYASLETLKKYNQQLIKWSEQHYWLLAVIFSASYAVIVALSIPVALLLSITSDYIFGIFAGTLYVLIGATLGATAVFLSVRLALGDWAYEKVRGWITKVHDEFQTNGFYYLLTLRLIPIIPFWTLNIIPAFFNLSLWQFMLATFLGIIPGTIVYVSIGNGLNTLIAAGDKINAGIMFRPEIIWPLIGLALLSLLPVIYRHMSQQPDDKNNL
jgi:uncharacterized membrane protein YdjX (TVP38/TMEM64 family)